ncbi:MAG: histidine kinase [Acidobacteria bacterium]|nr:histidine kinase [Acidobacteriota bacterium]
MSASNAADVLNLVGFATGTALYAMLLVLVLRGRRGGDSARVDRLPMATALLGLTWNVGELASYLLPRLGLMGDGISASALAFPSLGLLAAVVVHSVARDLGHGRLVIALAYTLAVAAAVLHVVTIVSGNPAASTLAFQLLTVCFGLLIIPLGLLTRAQPNGRRALWVLALVLFAVSATHLGSFHSVEDSWWMQLLGHHAAIPLAFAILYQNYRFALGDLFLKHALTLLAIVAMTLAGYSLVSAMPPGPLAQGLLLGLWVTTALVAPRIRAGVVRFVDAVLLGRLDYAVLRGDIARTAAEQHTVGEVMNALCRQLALAFNAREVRWTERDATDAGFASSRTVTLPTTDPPAPSIHVGELTGGRRLLSDDEALLDAAAVIAARRIDAIRLTLERYETQLREEEMQKLAAEAELKALRAQVNPHFLFNALTTIGYLIETAPPRAMQTLLRLTRLLRGVLRPEGEFTTVGRELELVEHYLDIERERFEERLRVRIDVPPALRGVPIPALVIQPLVENAIKHGVAPSISGGDVEVAVAVLPATGQLRITVTNTGSPLAPQAQRGGDHVGLDNVERRLAGHYGTAAHLTLGADPLRGTVAELLLPLGDARTRHEEVHAEAAARRARG